MLSATGLAHTAVAMGQMTALNAKEKKHSCGELEKLNLEDIQVTGTLTSVSATGDTT